MRLGLYGGTFDPIHQAHLQVATTAQAQFSLDRVLLIPNRTPPHKPSTTGASFEDRLAMIDLAVAPFPSLASCDIENRSGKSFTIQTLELLRTHYREAEFFFLIGADAFAEVLTWYRVEEVFAATEFIVVSRPGADYVVPPGARVHRLDALQLRTSSTDIRQQLALGLHPEELPPPVAAYIEEKGLYSSP